MIPNHPEPEQIQLENVLLALGNPLRLAIIRQLADGSEASCNALRTRLRAPESGALVISERRGPVVVLQAKCRFATLYAGAYR